MPQSYRSGLEVMSKNTEINLSFGRTDTARLGRIKQLERWNKSDVAKESGTELKHRKSRKIKFQDNVVFHSAVISGDTDEVERLLKDGYDVNCINDDGLTGLHHELWEAAFKKLNFDLRTSRGVGLNSSKEEMLRLIDLLNQVYIREGDVRKSYRHIAFVFSGHGYDGRIYSQHEECLDLKKEVFPRIFHDKRDTFNKLIFVDACRTSIDDGKGQKSLKISSEMIPKSRNGDGISGGVGAFIAYATLNGRFAPDSRDGSNFSKCVTKWLQKDETIEAAVTKATAEIERMPMQYYARSERINLLSGEVNLYRESLEAAKKLQSGRLRDFMDWAVIKFCIEEDWDMVQLLVDHGANVNATDFEGWTPLHAAASCGYEDICRLLLNHGADPSIVNNEGSTAVEQALEQEDEVIATMIQKEIEKQGISIEEVKSREHHLVMQEALELKGNPTLDWSLSTQGATPLHVAAAKGYLDVMEILLKARKAMLDCTDKDGWTPLHAAVYWGEFSAAEVLVINGADFSAVTLLGKSVDDLVNEDDAEQFEELKKFAGSAQQGLSNKQQRSLRTSSSGDVKPSPQAVRRRLSKELSRESLKMDMYNEKRTLENAPNNIAEETEPSTSPSLVPEGKEIIEQLIEGSENAKEKEREKEKKGKLEENSVKPSSTAKEGEEQEVKVSQPSRVKDSQAAMESERETKKTDSNRNGEAAAPVEKQSQEKSPPDDTETGMFRPRSQGVGSLGRKVSGSVHSMIRQLETKIETEGSVVPRPKSESFSGNLPAGAVGRTGSGGEVKRFPFQPKTIPNKTSPIAARKTSVTSSGTSPSTAHKYDQKGTITVHSTAQPTKTDTKRGTPSLPLKTENKISITTKASASASASTKMGNNVSSPPHSTPPQTSPAGSPTSSPKGELVRRLSARNKISSTLDNLMKGQRRVSLSSTSSEAGTDKDSTKSHSRTGSVEVDTVFKESDSTKMHTNTKVPTSNQNGATAVLPTDEPTLPPSTHNTDCVDMSRSSSMSSNLSTPSNDYSVSRASSRDESQKSEMARKRVARRERKERKATQGVSQEDFKLLMQGSDEDLTKSKLEDSTGESPLMSRRDTDLDTTYEGDSSLFQTPPPTSSTKIQPETLDSSSQLKPSEESSTTLFESSPEKSTSGKNYVMSAFKPRDRPQPKKILDSPHLGQSGVLWSTPEMERRKQVKTDGEPSSRDTPTIVKEERREEDDEKTLDKKQSAQVKVEPKDEDSQFLSPNERSRAKSVARRKKKEKRRSTGIKFSDEDESISEEDLPEELKKIVAKGKKKKSEKTKSDAQKSNGKEEKKDVVGATKVEEGQVRRDAEQEEELRKLQERLRELEDLLRMEQEACSDLKKKHDDSLKKNEHAKKLNAELMKKCEESTRALEKQKQESGKQRVEAEGLRKELALTESIKFENQRLKDENKALIRVIAKMSRAPGVNA